MTKSELAAAVSRIERAPNVTLLLLAIEAAYPDNAIAVNRVGGQWEVSDYGFAQYASSFADVRRRLASSIEDLLSHTVDEEPREQAAPAMVPQQAQQQQACAAPAAIAPAVSTAMAEVLRLDAMNAALREKKNEALAVLRTCREERLAAVAGDLDACPGVCWTNEERARVRYDEACEAIDACTSDYWEALEYLSDEEREQRRESLKARIAQGPAMVMQQAQQQQADAGIDRSAVMRDAWGLARQLSSGSGKPPVAHIPYAIHRTSDDASRLAHRLATAAPDSIDGRVVRIETAPDADALVQAVAEACGGNGVRLVHAGGTWTLYDGVREAWCAPTELRYARRYVAAFVDNILRLEVEEAGRMVAQQAQLQQANAGTAAAADPGPVPAWLLEAVHGPNNVDEPKLEDLDYLRDLLRACGDQRAFLALLGDNDDEVALQETIRGAEDLYRRLAKLVGHRTDIHDREHPDRVAEGQAWVASGSDIPF